MRSMKQTTQNWAELSGYQARIQEVTNGWQHKCTKVIFIYISSSMQNLDTFGIFVLELHGGNRKMTGLSRIFGLQSCICGDARMERESASLMGALYKLRV